MASVRKIKDASIVSASSENSSELSVQFNSPEVNEQISNALEIRKENMIIQQAEIMQIDLFVADIQNIKSNLGDEYLNAAEMEVAIVNALVDYQEGLANIVMNATDKAMQRLADIQNRKTANVKGRWQELQNKAKENTEAWASVRDFAVDKFSLDDAAKKIEK